jgi:hypothetical protein
MEETYESAREIWGELVRAGADPKHAWHLGTLGTLFSGEMAMRSVVLRKADAASRLLICYTDLRTGKIRHITQNPVVSWLFYHPKKMWQLRITGQATWQHGSGQLWQQLPAHSKRDYASVLPPGAALPEGEEPALLPDEAASQNFVVLTTVVETMDSLWLKREGHLRVLYQWDGNEWAAQRVCP